MNLHLSRVIGYKYGSNSFSINRKSNINLINGKYALVSYSSKHKSYLRILSYLYHLRCEDNFIYYKEEDISQEKIELFVYDDAQLSSFIKDELQLEDQYEYPYFIVEYSENIPLHIAKILHEKHDYQTVLNTIKIEKIEINKKVNQLMKKMNYIKCDEKDLHEEMRKLYNRMLLE